MNKLILLVLLICSQALYAQKEVVKVFRGSRIINSESVEIAPKGTLKFIISHRFGALSTGAYNLWGLDNANIRLGFDYGVTKNLNIGFGRNSLYKMYDFFAKYQILQQSEGMPLSLVYYTNGAINTLRFNDAARAEFTNRLSFAHQIIAGRRLSDRLSLQLMPTFVHRNYVGQGEGNNDVYSLGVAARIQATKILALIVEYFYIPPGQLPGEFKHPLGIGLEIETKGHIFQLNFLNSQAMVTQVFLPETRGEILSGGIHFGFNISRDFKVGPARY